jgi:hypothetical protein
MVVARVGTAVVTPAGDIFKTERGVIDAANGSNPGDIARRRAGAVLLLRAGTSRER